ncbi:hypothetical protein ACIQKB_10085 [Streptomyces sp. NPDC092046]|uniref:hypothetical protein n=1 Tax=Streptomyces sp. NPDC092046 TaxID=3366009 RepID=UPI00381C945B
MRLRSYPERSSRRTGRGPGRPAKEHTQRTTVAFALGGPPRLLHLPPGRRPRPTSALTPDWFPKDASGKATARCGLYCAYVDGHTLYAWRDNQDWIKDNKAGSPH